ncbi:putative glucose-fructose oxidoreductase [Rubellimicrobium mesophilum DSM 19309]|uniref:Putative glucose-fructose oxidoreductase n=1 Tax=Rubellimicrobium mesophilum DSM 19309 TaxID=442562 RepID=A0A017HKQ2_9RHOB|nr:Gfo/Idh/MocA family oxidoreductase [Rubellimicrobium mesophilum]EYD74910.1 putative glucose-fructose oxidoreductase [Rubellimicrobium mesophilum DSM 19309]
MRRVVGINFDHMHMGDLLRQAHDHPGAEIAGICDADPTRMRDAVANFALPPERVFTDVATCLQATRPDLVILCPATAEHAAYVEQVAPLAPGATIMVEKPFAASLAEADRMIAAAGANGCPLAINWPLAWYRTHNQTKRLIDDGTIGQLLEVHFHDGNRGPLYHLADKVEVSREEVERRKPGSWWYKAASGGGSLLDYLGYGATLGTWFMDGEAPLEVTSTTWAAPGLEVDEHSVTVLRYERGLSRMETRWGTLTDPWTFQPQPRCGFVVVGSEGSISSWDYDDHVTVQTRARPEAFQVHAHPMTVPRQGPIQYLLHCIETGERITGPLDPAVSRTGQRIVDTAFASAREKRTLPLVG